MLGNAKMGAENHESNYESRRAALRSAQEQDGEIRRVMKDCAQQVSRAKAEAAKDAEAADTQLKDAQAQVAALQQELATERSQAVQAARSLKKKHADAARLVAEQHIAEALRRDSEAAIVGFELLECEQMLERARAAHLCDVEGAFAAHSAQLEAVAREHAHQLKERSAKHMERLKAVVASEEQLRSECASLQRASRRLEDKVHALADEIRLSDEQRDVEKLHASLLAAELGSLEMTSTAAVRCQVERVHSLGEQKARLSSELHRRDASHVEELALQRDAHARQLETVEERVRALITRKEADLTALSARLAGALHELAIAKTALAEVID